MYDAYFNKIYRFLYWQTSDKVLADDFTGEVFTKAWQKYEDFNGKYPQAWLYKIARNLVTDHWRKKRDERVDDKMLDLIADDKPTAAEQLDKQTQEVFLKRALDSLENRVRQVITLRLVENVSAAETAKRLDLSESNVRVLQHRGLKQLRKWYDANN